MKTSDNKKSPIRINSIVFAIFWALSYVIGAGASYFLTFTLFEPPLQTVPWWYTFGMIFTMLTTMGAVSGSIQRMALWLRFGRRLTWWRRASVVGWWLGGLVIFAISRLTYDMEMPDDINLFLQPIPLTLELFIPLIGLHWLVLRRHVDKAWLYVLASVSSAVTFAALLMANNSGLNLPGMILALGSSALAMAYTLVWLFSMSGSIISKQDTAPDTTRLTTPDVNEQDSDAISHAETASESYGKGG